MAARKNKPPNTSAIKSQAFGFPLPHRGSKGLRTGRQSPNATFFPHQRADPLAWR